MPISGQRRIIHLYIRPTHGPVSFMELDVDLVEQAAMEWGGAQRDSARVQEITRQITQKFPGVQVANYRTSIATLVARLSSSKDFAALGLGFVLEVPGSIQQQPAPSTDSPQQQEKVQELEKTMSVLKTQLAQAMTARVNAEKDVMRLGNELRQLKAQQGSASQRDLQNAQQLIYQANQRVNQIQMQLATRDREIEMYGRESGDLRTRYEGLEMKYTTLEQDYKGLEARFEGSADQVSALRDERNEAVQAKEQLEQALQARDQQIKYLEARLHELTMGATTETSLSGGGPIMLG